MSKKVGIGVAGAGVFGGHHASKYAAHENAELIGVFDIDNRSADKLAARLGVAQFDRYDDLLDNVEAVVIAAPASRHFELARKALEQGRHVFVEKPIALATEQADILIFLAEREKLTLQVGHQERYVFGTAGLLNRDIKPVKIDCIRCAAASGRCEDVSVVFDLMVHDLDLVRQLTSAELVSVEAAGDRNDLAASLTLECGAAVNLRASRRAPVLDRRMTLVYEDGVIEFDFVKREITNTTPAKLDVDFSDNETPLAFSDPLAFGADQFLAAILENKKPTITGQDGRAAVDWALKIEKAAFMSVDNTAVTEERLLA